MKKPLLLIASICAVLLCAAVLFALRFGAPASSKQSPSSGSASIFDGLPGQSAIGGDKKPGLVENPAALEQARAMHKALPGNVFLPPLPDDADRVRMDKRNHLLNRLRKVHYKIESGRASNDERAEYYAFRVKYNRDKIAMLKYVAVRGKTPGLDANAMAPHITKMIKDLEKEIREFEKNIPLH